MAGHVPKTVWESELPEYPKSLPFDTGEIEPRQSGAKSRFRTGLRSQRPSFPMALL